MFSDASKKTPEKLIDKIRVSMGDLGAETKNLRKMIHHKIKIILFVIVLIEQKIQFLKKHSGKKNFSFLNLKFKKRVLDLKLKKTENSLIEKMMYTYVQKSHKSLNTRKQIQIWYGKFDSCKR